MSPALLTIFLTDKYKGLRPIKHLNADIEGRRFPPIIKNGKTKQYLIFLILLQVAFLGWSASVV